MASIIKEHLQRLKALEQKAFDFIDKIQEKEGGGNTAEVQTAAEMWSKLKAKVEALTLLDQSIDIQEEDLRSNDVPADVKEIIKERLGRDLQDAPSKVKSALRVEKQINTYLAEAQIFLNTPKEDDQEENPKKEPEKKPEKPKRKEPKPKKEKPAPAVVEEQKIIKQLEDSVDKFQKGVPEIEKGVYEELVAKVKDLQTQGGKILNSVQNLKLINEIANKLERVIISEGYKDSVREFIDAFDVVDSLQKQYFAAFNFKFKPAKTLPIIKSMAVDKTINGLLGQGLKSNVVDRIHSILTDNVTSGGSYASLNEQLRSTIVGGEENEGLLQRYSKTFTVDAINQYSAQYHEALAQDLNMNWGRYIGSNLTTTREFCIYLEKKEWVHRSELPAIIQGDIDGHQCKLSKSSGLPLGMIPGTNVDNFKIRRGGWNCGHQFFWTPDSAVPEAIKQRVAK